MKVILGSGRHHDTIARKIVPEPDQLELQNYEGVYDFLEALSSTTNPWDKAVLLFSALDDKEEGEITEVFDLFVEQGLRNREATMVFVDKQESYKELFYACVMPRVQARYLTYDKLTIPVLEEIICGEVMRQSETFTMPPEVDPVFQPVPPPPIPEPPAPPEMPPPPPPPPPQPEPQPVQQFIPQPPPPPPMPQQQFVQPQQSEPNALQKAIDKMKQRRRTFIITGERRSGVSGTVANMAWAASSLGVNVLVVDMDMIRRGQYVYFPQNFTDYDTKYTHALSNVLRNYIMLEECAWQITDTLSVLGLDFSITDARLQESYADTQKMFYLVTAAKGCANIDLTLIDMPFEKLSKYASVIPLAEKSAFVMENDVMGLVNFIHSMVPDEFEATVDFQVFESRMGLIINKFNPENQYLKKPIVPQDIPNILCDISDDLIYDGYEIFGTIPWIPNYGLQADGAPLLVQSSQEYLMTYFKMLYKMYD